MTAAIDIARNTLGVRLYDAHNHLQDHRLASHLNEIMTAAAGERVTRMVVNGSSEKDWPAVAQLAATYPQVFPCFGYHPWFIHDRTPEWKNVLLSYLDRVPSGLGEIGLDHWIIHRDDAQQEEVFLTQWRIAAERNLPVSIHCVEAWARFLELIQSEACPSCGFLLHSFGGPKEMIPRLAELGAYFSIPGYFALARKTYHRESFRHVPPDRLLIETDAPDQLLPEERVRYHLHDALSHRAINHPANIAATYEFVAGLLGRPLEDLARQVEENFNRLFGGLTGKSPA